MHIQRMQPWRLMSCLESMRVLMRILLAHHLKALQVEVRQVLAVLASGLFQCICHDEIYKWW
jgi:hypothetical protein